jgi:hypothetical protein
MYGFEGVLIVGLLTRLSHGTLFGLVFAAVLSDPGLVYMSNSILKTVLAGLVFGFVLTIVGTGFLLPAWSQFAGLSNPPDMPWVTMGLFSWHAIYGVVLGLLFPFLEEL